MKKRIWNKVKERDIIEGFDRFLISENTNDTDFVATIPAHWNKSEENAKLICAAPDLLEAAKEAISTIETLMREHDDNGASYLMSLRQINKAIKKAIE